MLSGAAARARRRARRARAGYMKRVKPADRPPFPQLLPGLLAMVLVAGGGCDEQLPGSADTPGASASGAPTLTQSRPATPAPLAIATPVHESPPPVATPVPRAVATVTPTPPPIAPTSGPSASPSPAASASPTASPSATPSPAGTSGPFSRTGAPADLAVSGPGYFVLATKPNPVGIEDLLFTRHGHFRLKAESSGSVPVFRLRHADHAFYVVGYQVAGEPAVPPAETAGEDQAVLATTWGATGLAAAGLSLDADRNPQAQSQLAFDYTGKLLVAGGAPRAADGQLGTLYVAIAQFDSPDRLVPALGFPGILRYETSALEPAEPPTGGQVRLGVAVSGVGRPLGNANLILSGSLETP